MSRKFLITLILILFLLPFVSWYYLKSGLTWRQKAQEIMNGTQPFPEGQWIDNAGRKLSSAQIEGHVTLVAQLSCDDLKGMSETLDAFYKQFKDTKKTNFIILDACHVESKLFSDSLKVNWFVFTCPDSTGLCKSLLGNWPDSKTHALVDKNKIIRSYYPSSKEEEKRILLEHMALLLPRDRSDKIELRRGQSQ